MLLALGAACTSPVTDLPDTVNSGGSSGGGGAGGAATGGTGSTGGRAATGGAGGMPGTGGLGAKGGAGGTGGTGGASAGRGGTAGSPAGAGGAGSAGREQGGSAGRNDGGAGAAMQTGGSAGAGSGGLAGTGGSAGAAAGGGSGGSTTAVPSAGCGKSGRPSGGVITVNNDHIYTFPTSYDGTKPLPLFIGMHAAGNPIDQIKKLTDGSALDTGYVRAFPKSAGNEWVYNTDLNKVTGMYDDLVSNYCVDESRVFAAGHSSGAQMIVQILVHADAASHIGFKAVAPVAASNYGAISSPIPVMYIQGKMDNVRNSNGADVVARFTTVNGCDSGTMAYSAVAGCMSNGKSVNPGCVSYDGCTEPTIWCSHDDPEYSNTNHGWPCFATKAMSDFFASLP